MSRINVLDFEIANLIAAGEVVERPSSVLKELIENSIDSGATSIVAEIKRGGVSLIRVSDNGCGMDREDLPVAIKRHATSKIKEREDLDKIITLGFRGEALAAISSVSEVTIISKTKDAELGSMLTSEGGKIVDVSEVGCADGTTVVVENLFYNVPARRKFLKKDSTEAMNCVALVEKVALSRPDISIQLTVEGEERFKTPGDNNLLNAIYAIYGKEFSSKLIKAEGTADGIRVHGYIGRSDNVRKNRNLQNIFINNRYVKSLTAMAAIEKAYVSYIAPEAFPVCVLFIDINPTMVDVNVHPAKLEVKFANEQPVFEAIYYTVKRAIEDYEYRPEMKLENKSAHKNFTGAFVPVGADTRGEQIKITSQNYTVSNNVSDTKKADLYDKPLHLSSGAESRFNYNTQNFSGNSSELSPKSSLSILEKYATAQSNVKHSVKTEEKTEQNKYEQVCDLSKAKIEVENEPQYKLVGEAFNCYIIIEYEGALLIIDKHAAHERVLFEELKKRTETQGNVSSQRLLLPITVVPTPDEISCAEEYKSSLMSVGYDFYVGDSYINITAIPDSISSADAEGLFVQMLDELIEGRGNPEITEGIRREKALYQIACKAAIKGGRVYDSSVTEWLISKVLSLPDVIVCPHGRPIAFRLTKAELDRQFDRIK